MDKFNQGWGRHYKLECRIEKLLGFLVKNPFKKISEDVSNKNGHFQMCCRQIKFKKLRCFTWILNKHKYFISSHDNFSKAPHILQDSVIIGWFILFAYKAFGAPKANTRATDRGWPRKSTYLHFYSIYVIQTWSVYSL